MKSRPDRPIVLFDGICNLCNGMVNFLIDHDPQHQFRFAAIQSATGQRLLNEYPALAAIDSIVLIDEDRAYIKSDAALYIVRRLKAPRSWLYMLRGLPRSWRDKVYDYVARNRYRFFGRTEACRVPTPALKALFLD